MRIDVRCANRVGMTHAVLGVLATSGVDLSSVEMVTHHVYLDAPTIDDAALARLRNGLLKVDGVLAVEPIQVMPGERRALLLDTLLSALDEPVIALDGDGEIIFANPAARDAAGKSCLGRRIETLFDGAPSLDDLLSPRARRHHAEVTLNNSSYLLEVLPVIGDSTDARGAIIRLQSARRMGQRLSSLQMHGHRGFSGIIGDSNAIVEAKKNALRCSKTDLPVLISGETGTGKELFARAIHDQGTRHDAPFLALNCAALPESLAESELFGYAPGAFSGASRSGKPGLLELADKGTVLLDEIGEMTPYLQAKLLRFVQDGSFRRVGGQRERHVDVRILSATHRDLRELVRDGRFREDLLYRLNVLNLHLPPLRKRHDDSIALAEHFLTQACARLERNKPELSAPALAALKAIPWRGNVRELENSVYRIATLLEGDVLRQEHVKQYASADTTPSNQEPEAESWADALGRFEQTLLTRLIADYPSTRKLASRLKLSHSTVAEKLRRHGIQANR